MSTTIFISIIILFLPLFVIVYGLGYIVGQASGVKYIHAMIEEDLSDEKFKYSLKKFVMEDFWLIPKNSVQDADEETMEILKKLQPKVEDNKNDI